MGLAVRDLCGWVVGAALLVPGVGAFAAQATLVADAHVNKALPAVNSGAISNLNVGGGYTALLQFDLSTLPAGTTAAQVSRATLRLYCNRMDTAGLVSVQPVGGAWGGCAGIVWADGAARTCRAGGDDVPGDVLVRSELCGG